ncbi:type II toxin-antitoxin system prevent-host-death family antitoxin [Nocardia sp. NPDC049149]|uniref:type II toxin-antitoxin system prevent-host-death family antitoxin n=1 Tax=Nocardia sp. NPDC049149 TaxID=3364315 RepID=UPI0037142C29
MAENVNPDELSVRELRNQLADVLNDAAVRSRITYVTNRGRRYAAVVPVDLAEAEEDRRAKGAL